MTDNRTQNSQTDSTQNDDAFDIDGTVDEATDRIRTEIIQAVEQGEKTVDDAAEEIDAELNERVRDIRGEAIDFQLPLDEAFGAIYRELDEQGIDVDGVVARELEPAAEEVLYEIRRQGRHGDQRQ